jgi:hypothetical protein
VTQLSLDAIQEAIRCAWSVDTCDPSDTSVWSTENAALGQCAVTALVVHDLIGGQLLEAEVHFEDGNRQGFHYWNRLPGIDLDLTREQFRNGEVIGEPRLIDREIGGPWLAHEQYLVFRARVFAALGLPLPT